MKVVNKLDENYLQLVRNALYNTPHVSNSSSNGWNWNNSNFKSSTLNSELTLKKHVKSKTNLSKAKSRIKRRLKKRIDPKQATLLEECGENNLVNVACEVSKKTHKKLKNLKTTVQPFSVSTTLENTAVSNEIKNVSPSKSGVSISEKTKKPSVQHKLEQTNLICPNILEFNDRKHRISEKTLKKEKITDSKKKKSNASVNVKEEQNEFQNWHESPNTIVKKNLIKNKKVSTKKLEKDIRKINEFKKVKLTNNDNFIIQNFEKNIDLEETREEINDLYSDTILDSYDNGDVSIKGLKFDRFCSQFVPVHNECILQKEVHLNVPKKHFKITSNDLIAENVTQDMQPKFKEGKRKKQSSKVNIVEVKIIKPKDFEKDSVIKEKISKDITLEESYISDDGLETQVLQNSFASLKVDLSSEYQESGPKEIIRLTDNSILIILDPGCLTYFHGLCTVQVINGEIEVLGAIMSKSTGIKTIYSPRGSSLLYIKNNYDLFSTTIELKSLNLKAVPEEYINNSYNENSALVLCRPHKEPFIDFIESHISQIIFPDDFFGPRVDFNLKGVWNRLRTTDKWEGIFENVSHTSKVIIAGGKGVGKSTFLRFSVNALLKKFKQVRVVDLDSGQSEFTAPGVISLVTVEDQLLGPNYTHLLKPDCMILSHINIGHNVRKYLESVKYLLNFLKDLPPLPTLVNYPGFTLGFGLDIALNIIFLLEPDAVIEITSRNPSKNYKINLTPNNVSKYMEENIILCKDIVEPFKVLNYEHVILDSLAENQGAWCLEARQSREISMLSYLGKLMSERVRCISSSDINMYSINMSSLSIKNAEGQDISPLAVNANLVVLCSLLNAEFSLFFAYGYGVVRGVDMQNDTLVLLTPEPLNILEKVDHLVLGSVTIPPSLLMNVSEVKGLIPYVSAGEPVDFGQFTKRSYLPPGK